jgi:hypothetical protein
MSRVHYCVLASHLIARLTHSTSEPSACPPSSLDRLFSSLELRGSSLREYSGDSRDVFGHSAMACRPT